MVLASTACFGQQEGAESGRNQVVKLVLTPNLIYSSAFVGSYERVMKENQTLSLTGGVAEFPKLFGGSNRFTVDRESSSSGFVAGVDYRFYMKKENRFVAPHGVYIGPYINYYNFHNDRQIRQSSAAVGSDLRLVTDVAFLNVGGQIGYQFVVNDRWTFDFIFFGPSISNYYLKLDLEGNFSPDEENEVIEEILEQFPLLKSLLDDETVTLHGTNSKWAPGYRFTAMIGYKFGRKKSK